MEINSHAPRQAPYGFGPGWIAPTEIEYWIEPC